MARCAARPPPDTSRQQTPQAGFINSIHDAEKSAWHNVENRQPGRSASFHMGRIHAAFVCFQIRITHLGARNLISSPERHHNNTTDAGAMYQTIEGQSDPVLAGCVRKPQTGAVKAFRIGLCASYFLMPIYRQAFHDGLSGQAPAIDDYTDSKEVPPTSSARFDTVKTGANHLYRLCVARYARQQPLCLCSLFIREKSGIGGCEKSPEKRKRH